MSDADILSSKIATVVVEFNGSIDLQCFINAEPDNNLYLKLGSIAINKGSVNAVIHKKECMLADRNGERPALMVVCDNIVIILWLLAGEKYVEDYLYGKLLSLLSPPN